MRARHDTEGSRRVLVVPSGASVQFAFASRTCVGSVLLSGAGASIKTRAATTQYEHERRVASKDGAYSRIELPSYNCDLESLTVTAGGSGEVRVADLSVCRENSVPGDCSGLCASRCPAGGAEAAASVDFQVDRGHRDGVVDPLFGVQVVVSYTLADLPLTTFVNCSSPLNGSSPELCLTTWGAHPDRSVCPPVDSHSPAGYSNPNPYMYAD